MTNAPTIKGLRLDVHRNPEGDFTRGGITAGCESLTLVGVIDAMGPGRPEFVEYPEWQESDIGDDAPPVVAVVRTGWPHKRIRIHLESVDITEGGKLIHDGGRHAMYGGNDAGTDDSRFLDFIEFLTRSRGNRLPVHDRYGQ